MAGRVQTGCGHQEAGSGGATGEVLTQQSEQGQGGGGSSSGKRREHFNSLGHDGKTLGYDGLASDSTFKGQVTSSSLRVISTCSKGFSLSYVTLYNIKRRRNKLPSGQLPYEGGTCSAQ